MDCVPLQCTRCRKAILFHKLDSKLDSNNLESFLVFENHRDQYYIYIQFGEISILNALHTYVETKRKNGERVETTSHVQCAKAHNDEYTCCNSTGMMKVQHFNFSD